MNYRLYTNPSLPEHWIMHITHGPWLMFPTGQDGWRLRKILRGERELEAVSPEAARLALDVAGFKAVDLAEYV